MNKGKVLVIGPVGSGKSTLTKRLLGMEDVPVKKTQSLEYTNWIIDSPGEYSQNPMYYRTLMATALEAKVLLIVQDATRRDCALPPNFASGFPLNPIGVITKIDHPNADIETATRFLRTVLPVGDIYLTSSVTLVGIKELKDRILSYL
ncbi:ethanolamine utilization protein EutP [Geobacillus thermocatenulatus]|uniref:Ethanolamine utilization protein EutP n=1 Tax=Geobacillus thermocatenulatus TaxID=33938 RepID=A0A226QEX6_9BACL|nr:MULTISPECIES: EutP/PduV family microcompartment system protein [Geobacillus]ASS99260.1 ethanolamine utilization protein EutP [Geobacillus thermocatenulatus]KLR73313.1 ethanolamine utilization protein EutP [Geobacillus sp. T6]OXB89992.1 ethanolamine utilization protein EutP [Geobacillus thermocatenulatus]